MMFETTLIAKKFPPFALAFLLWQGVTFAGINVDENLAVRIIGAMAGGVVTWFWRNDRVFSRRVACLISGICLGIGLSPVVGYYVERYASGIPSNVFLWSFLTALFGVPLLEYILDNPRTAWQQVQEVWRGLRRRRATNDPIKPE